MMAGNEVKSSARIDKWCTMMLSREPPVSNGTSKPIKRRGLI